jgi:hypothetical protein
MNRNQITTLLKINGFAETSSDEDIRAVLLSAKYSEAEVTAALVILRENNLATTTRTDGLHKIFFSDDQLKPSEIAGLLGVDINLDSPVSPRSRNNAMPFFYFVFIWFVSVVLAVSGILFYMYINQIGLFHPVSTGLIEL